MAQRRRRRSRFVGGEGDKGCKVANMLGKRSSLKIDTLPYQLLDNSCSIAGCGFSTSLHLHRYKCLFDFVVVWEV